MKVCYDLLNRVLLDNFSGSQFDPHPAYSGNLASLSKGVRVLETAVGAVFALTRFFLVRISIRDLVADRNPSGVGGGGQNQILICLSVSIRWG